LAEEGADLEDASMTRLEGNFAMMLICRGGTDHPLRERLRHIEQELNLHIHLEPAADSPVILQPNAFISAIGPNRTGIVAAMSEIVARHGGNILEMSTQLLSRTAVPVYVVRLEACVPREWSKVEKELARVGREMSIETRLEHLETMDV